MRLALTIIPCYWLENLILALKILDKTLILRTTIIDEETIMDKIIDGLKDPFLYNDKYWMEHEPGSKNQMFSKK